MTDLIRNALCLVYVINAILLITLTDRLSNIQPLAKAFVLLGSAAMLEFVGPSGNTQIHAYTVGAFYAATPAVCAWSVLATCRPKFTMLPFAVVAVATWLVAMRLPSDDTPAQFLTLEAPRWQLVAGIYWFAIWIAWALATLVGWWKLYKAPATKAHIVAGVVAVSIATEALGILAWGTNANFIVITHVVDLALSVVVGTVAGYAIWKTRPSS